MSYVDLMGTVRWTEQDHTNRSEAYVRAKVPHPREHILMRRLLSMILLAILPADNPLRTMCSVPTSDQLGEVVAAATAYAEAEAAADAGRADGARLNAALDIEASSAALDAIPPEPADGSEDLYVDERARVWAAHQALLEAASEDVLQLLIDRTAALAPAPTPAEVA